MNFFWKIWESPTNGATGPHASKAVNQWRKEPPESEAAALEAGHASAVKLKNAKAAPHSVVASAREHKDDDDDDDDADGDDADGSGANWRAATKVDKEVDTMTPWMSSSALKSITLQLITRGFHGRRIIFTTKPIYGRLSIFSCTIPELRFSSSLKEAQGVNEEVFTSMICTE